jgi:hypothetical protein
MKILSNKILNFSRTIQRKQTLKDGTYSLVSNACIRVIGHSGGLKNSTCGVHNFTLSKNLIQIFLVLQM